MFDDLIVKVITRLTVPFILLYGAVVVLHGGGFPGGAILGSTVVLYSLAYGLEEGFKRLPLGISKVMVSGGVFWYAIIGMVGIVAGGFYLDNKIAGFPMGIPGSVLSAGMIPILTVGIGIKVWTTVVTLFRSIIEEDGLWDI